MSISGACCKGMTHVRQHPYHLDLLHNTSLLPLSPTSTACLAQIDSTGSASSDQLAWIDKVTRAGMLSSNCCCTILITAFAHCTSCTEHNSWHWCLPGRLWLTLVMLSRACAIRRADSVMGTGSREAAASLLGASVAPAGLLSALPSRPGKGVAPARQILRSALPTACRTAWMSMHVESSCEQTRKRRSGERQSSFLISSNGLGTPQHVKAAAC